MKSFGHLKRRSRLAIVAAVVDDSTGAALTGATANLSCQARYSPCDPYALATATISETATAGTYLFDFGSTATWRPGVVQFDIKYTDGSNPSFTETFTITIEGSITE